MNKIAVLVLAMGFFFGFGLGGVLRWMFPDDPMTSVYAGLIFLAVMFFIKAILSLHTEERKEDDDDGGL